MSRKPSRRTLKRGGSAGFGRPKIPMPELARVEAIAGLVEADREIAIVLGVSERTLNTWKKNPDFFQALKNGKIKLDVNVKNSLYKLAIGGNVTACIFWLKNRDREHWRDQQQQEHSGRVEAILRFAYGNGNGHA
jgi:hypothetical protein